MNAIAGRHPSWSSHVGSELIFCPLSSITDKTTLPTPWSDHRQHYDDGTPYGPTYCTGPPRIPYETYPGPAFARPTPWPASLHPHAYPYDHAHYHHQHQYGWQPRPQPPPAPTCWHPPPAPTTIWHPQPTPTYCHPVMAPPREYPFYSRPVISNLPPHLRQNWHAVRASPATGTSTGTGTGTSTPTSLSPPRSNVGSTPNRLKRTLAQMSDDSGDVVYISGLSPEKKASSTDKAGPALAKKAKVREVKPIIVEDDSQDEASDEEEEEAEVVEVLRPTKVVGGKVLRGQDRPAYAPPHKEKRKPRPSKIPWNKPSTPLKPVPKAEPAEVVTVTAPEAITAVDGALADTRRRAFFRKHRNLFLALLPDHTSKSFLNLTASSSTDDAASVAPFVMLPQPKGIKGKMHAYQLHGLSFLAHLVHANGINAILADEMGLGKTLQTLSLLVHLNSHTAHGGGAPKSPHLIVCPLSVLSAWMSETVRWTGLKAFRFHGERKERERLKNLLRDPSTTAGVDLVITTYECYLAEVNWFRSRTWHACVLDEGHKIKSSETLISQALQPVRSQHRLILTGTPLQNNLVELWSILHWLYPKVFTDQTRRPFEEAFDLSKGTYDQEFLKAARKLLELVMLRRTKEGVKTQLSVPPREEITLYVPLSVCQRFWTKRLLMKQDDAALKDIFDSDLSIGGGTVGQGDRGDEGVRENMKYAVKAAQTSQSYRRLMALLMQLRKVCDHPYMMPDSEPEPFGIEEHLVSASAKLVMLDKLLGAVLPRGSKVLIFSGFTRMLDILEDYLTLRGTAFLRLDGGTSRPRRNLGIRVFQQNDATGPPVFLISTRAGGLGINLTAADTVVLFDSDWNPQVDIQAIARAHRIGQTRPVTVYRLICHESVEQQMLGRIAKKLYLSLKIMGNASSGSTDGLADESATEVPSLSSGELCAILKGGAGALARPWGSDSNATDGGFAEFQKATFEECVARGKEADARRDAKIAQELGHADEVDAKVVEEAEAEERELLKGVEQVQTRLFEGKRWEKPKKTRDIGREWKEEAKREIKQTVVEVEGHMVQADTVTNDAWTAVKTITSDPEMLKRLQDVKRTKRKFDHENYCIVCRDGGEVYECAYCPRVMHGPCSGYSEAELDKMLTFACGQHRCVICRRGTVQAGNLLFRCRYCSDSYCEDCMPDEDFRSVGDTIPEFEVLGYRYIANAHFIHCRPCQDHFEVYPQAAADWAKGLGKAEKALQLMRVGM